MQNRKAERPPELSLKAQPLSLNVLPQIEIPPSTKNLSLSLPTLVSISPIIRTLSRCDQLPSELVPGIINKDEDTICTYIDGYSLETIFICKVCYCDQFRSTEAIKTHIREVHKISIQSRADYTFKPRYECLSSGHM